MTRFLLQALLICVVFIAAWRAGGKPERYVASLYLSMLVASGLNGFLRGSQTNADYQSLHAFHFLLDVTALGVVTLVALRYDRWWTLWVGSVQLIAVIAHFLRVLDLPLHPLAYAVMERWPVWMAVLLTGAGTFFHRRRTTASITVT